MPGATRFDAMDVGVLLGILKRGRKTILVWISVFVALGVGLDVFLPPVYRATVRLEIRKPPDRSPLTGQSIASSGFQSENVSMYTAAERIKDRMLLGEIAAEFGPMGWIQTLPASAGNPQDVAGRFQWATAAAARTLHPTSVAPVDRTTLEAQVDWLRSIIAVEPVQDTRLVDVRVDHHDPQAARTIADRLAGRFVEGQCRQSADADTSGLVYLTAQLTQMRERFQGANNKTGSDRLEGPAVLEARIRTLGDEAAELNSEYLKIHSERVELQARLRKIAMSDPGSPDVRGATIAEDGVLAGLQRDLESCRVQLASARDVYKSKHPRLVALESQYAALESAFLAEQRRAVSRLEAEDAILAAREAAARSARKRSERALDEAEKQSERSAGPHAELKAEQDLYALLAAKIQQGRVEELLKSRPVEIVDAATLAPHPVRPRKVLNLAVCLMTGMLLGSVNRYGINDLKSALTFLAKHPDIDAQRLGAIGFCMGGGFAIAWACTDSRLKAIAPFYGMNPRPLSVVGQLCPVVGSYPERDFTARGARSLDEALTEKGIAHDIKIYPGAQHSFFNDTRSAYDKEAAEDSWRRVLAHFGERLR